MRFVLFSVVFCCFLLVDRSAFCTMCLSWWFLAILAGKWPCSKPIMNSVRFQSNFLCFSLCVLLCVVLCGVLLLFLVFCGRYECYWFWAHHVAACTCACVVCISLCEFVFFCVIAQNMMKHTESANGCSEHRSKRLLQRQNTVQNMGCHWRCVCFHVCVF